LLILEMRFAAKLWGHPDGGKGKISFCLELSLKSCSCHQRH